MPRTIYSSGVSDKDDFSVCRQLGLITIKSHLLTLTMASSKWKTPLPSVIKNISVKGWKWAVLCQSFSNFDLLM